MLISRDAFSERSSKGGSLQTHQTFQFS
ncbi:hypothetical protein RS9916_33427 [Synechococcus sp. RS9916]|nr:hypothetical protein RS9916_33427 [Synechococcus sp. RS9916]